MANSLSLLAYYVHYTKYSPAPPFHSQQYADKASFINTHFTTTRTHLQSSSRGNGVLLLVIYSPNKHTLLFASSPVCTPSIPHSGDFTHWTLNCMSRVYSALVDSQHQHQDEALQGKSGTPHCLANIQYKGNDNRRTKLIIISRSVRPVESVSHRLSWTTLLRALPTQGFDKGKVSQSTVIIRENPSQDYLIGQQKFS